ncbi:MAG TPA: helix-turn-helix domain-containing protein [Gemmatimonadaceae bacterium]|nr:helix-turn-helix domain-containing protein [Gemmatimonadaceae bacterium]
MDVSQEIERHVAAIAAAIAEPARARMLFALLDGRARTSTELALIGGVAPPTASTHLARLKAEGLVRLHAQGRHRYYALDGSSVADALEALSRLAGGSRRHFVPNTPTTLRAARTCYDHIAGALGVALHDRFLAQGCIAARTVKRERVYDLTAHGEAMLHGLGVDVAALRAQRRRFAFGCLDWSERRPHIGGALGAALLDLAMRRKWIARERDGRALRVTPVGQRELGAHFGVRL